KHRIYKPIRPFPRLAALFAATAGLAFLPHLQAQSNSTPNGYDNNAGYGPNPSNRDPNSGAAGAGSPSMNNGSAANENGGVTASSGSSSGSSWDNSSSS